MAHAPPVEITPEPVNLTNGMSAGDQFIGQVTGRYTVYVVDAPSAAIPDVSGVPGFAYKEGDYIRILVAANEGNWAYVTSGKSRITLRPGT